MSTGLDWIKDPCMSIDTAAAEAARQRQDQLTKPRGSLGRLEEMAIRLCGMQGTATPSPDPVQILQFVSDHGVAAEGISLFPQVVSVQMLHNIARGGAAVSVMAEAVGARMEIFDLGVVTDPGPIEGVRSERLGAGSGNIAREPAMTEEQLAAALALGRAAVERALANGARLLICGEMGIGNTTPATALACALLGLEPAALAGPGTGLDAGGVSRKAAVVAKALTLHAAPGRATLELLRRLGGFDIAASAGAYIAAAQRGLPILVDGFIMSSAALVAVRLNPCVRDWMLFAHRSAEPGHRHMMEALGADPYLDLGLRLGEATGAETLVPLLRLACVVHQRMATFAEAGVSEA
ncbi:nicotinate-nucleotide--dimethylbenzimidazole phosphoribosyltransferase [Thiocystis violascens]|uniref:Nicotinate-nucleotide--dimethylbenzimidazole phosphoribosyltransferase n=1 Tax=Thiocystis violascens (strain ATCC 17096 / DSM 198 / 6111) TaxID=765911 RepID=I3Y9H8_THIV6|nr:nicotinate-nucleotide--dimethylbenzimidazole phosphoribosyltransferase [Thiocystis violascens]AFL73646.1 nicotinate-nucleotide-dimethylbenzimidazole phosphoribosyltransferase [Thiocystis violascens DSM 198]